MRAKRYNVGMLVILLVNLSWQNGWAQNGQVYWQTDSEAAQRIAEAQSRLLLVVWTEDDFLQDPRAGQSLQALNELLAGQPALQQLLADRTVGLIQSVGPPERLYTQPGKTHTSITRQGNIALGFCNAKLQVLSLVVGFPDSSLLMRELEHAAKLSLLDPTMPEQTLATVSQYRFQQLDATWQEWLTPILPTIHGDESPSRGTEKWKACLWQAIRSTEVFLRQDTGKRMGLLSSEESAVLNSLLLHADSRDSMSHAILCLAPLVDWNIIAKLIAEVVWHQEAWELGVAETQLKLLLSEVPVDEPVLLRIKDSRLATDTFPVAFSRIGSPLEQALGTTRIQIIDLPTLALLSQRQAWQAIHVQSPSPMMMVLCPNLQKSDPVWVHMSTAETNLLRSLKKLQQQTVKP